MYRSSPARKYGPLAMLAAVQLVVVLVAPSVAPTTATDLLGADGFAGVPGATGGVGDPALAGPDGALPDTVLPDGTVVPGGSPTAGGAAPTGTTGATTGTAAGAATGGTAGATGAAPVATGDTAHCVDGRQFDPAIDFFAPPCAPGKPGAKAGDNGGATSMGVSADTITVVHYVPDYGAEVNAILRAQGLYYDAATAQSANAAFASFLNSRYQLHGRKIDIKTFQGTCRTVPPQLQCLLPEMNRIVDTFKPYAVFFQTTVCSACFAELARRKVVSFGGAGFSEEFRNALKPYNYDYSLSSSKVARLFAQWWCGSLAGKPAVHAGAQNPAQDFRTRKRQLGVVSTNDPDNARVVKQVLYPELAKCGEDVDGHEYFYEQNVATATQQSQAGTAVMNSPQNPATSVVCFCDPVAPQFSYNAASTNNYWPEALFATNQAMDSDPTGQSYMGELACPQGDRGCSFDGALGLGTAEASVSPAQLAGMKVFAAAQPKATAPLSPLVMEIFWQNYNMLGSLVQAAGPRLTPATMAGGAPRLGARGGGATGKPLRAFVGGELSWTQDVFVTYWAKRRKSAYNGLTGAFVQAYGGKRFGLGQLPPGEPAVPTVDKRS